MFGCTNVTLLIDAASLVLLGPWHEPFLWLPLRHGSSPKPTVKKNLRSTLFGTFAGNFEFAKLRIFRLNLIEKPVSLNRGSAGFRRGRGLFFFEFDKALVGSYSRNPVTVVLSKAAGAVA